MMLELLPSCNSGYLPFDGEASDSGLFCEDVASNTLDDGFGRGIVLQLLAIIFIVHIVPNAYEFSSIV